MTRKMQKRKRKVRQTAKFIWRYLFTIGVMTWLVYLLGRGCHVPFAGALFFSVWAIVLDWGKMKKSRWGKGEYRSFEKIQTLQEKYPGDPNIVGTPTYLMNSYPIRHY
ncbi:MAG: hypothetical protein WCG04_01110 [Alphaproteobacteria bacterium]